MLCCAQQRNKGKESRKHNLEKQNKSELMCGGTGGNWGKMNWRKLRSSWTDAPSCYNGKSGCLCVNNICTSTIGCTGLSSCKLNMVNNINLIMTQWFILLYRNFYGLICRVVLTRQNNIQSQWRQLFQLCGTAAVSRAKGNMEKLSGVQDVNGLLLVLLASCISFRGSISRCH